MNLRGPGFRRVHSIMGRKTSTENATGTLEQATGASSHLLRESKKALTRK